MRGPLGFSVLGISPNFDSVFRFSHLKTAVFRFWCLARFGGFGFRFLSTIRAGFRHFQSNAFHDFSGFAKKVAGCSRAKTVIPRDFYVVL